MDREEHELPKQNYYHTILRKLLSTSFWYSSIPFVMKKLSKQMETEYIFQIMKILILTD